MSDDLPFKTPFDCAAAKARASVFLDGRLRAESRRAVQDHLRSCPDCVAFFRQLSEVSRLVQRTPDRPVAPDLAMAVRREVSHRRRSMLQRLGLSERRAAGVAAAAALLLLGGSFSAGYLAGRADVPGGAGAPGRPVFVQSQAHENASPLEAPHLASFDAGRFERAARGLVNDIELIDSVPESERVPLVNAQLQLFDLDAQAVHILRVSEQAGASVNSELPPLRGLARFVHGLAIAVADASQVPQWRKLQADARRRGLSRMSSLASLGPGKLRPRAGRKGEPVMLASSDEASTLRDIVGRVGGELPQASRGALQELLAFKVSFVSGRVDASIRYAKTASPKEVAGGLPAFELITGAVVVRTLSEAGLLEEARTVITRVTTRTRAPKSVEVLQELANDLRKR